MDMTKETIDALKDLGTTADGKRIVYDNGGHEFLINGSKVEEFIPSDQPIPLEVRTLSAMARYVLSQKDDKRKLYIHVKSPRYVELTTATDEYGRRAVLMIARAPLGTPTFNQYKDVEIMNVEIQSQFVPNDDSETILKVIGNLQEENVTSTSDDGVSQSVTVKTGVASVDKVRVPNPVTLKPYRTFFEINQPESLFIFRMQNGMQASLFEVTNGSWIFEATQNIARYFSDNLLNDVEPNTIEILA